MTRTPSSQLLAIAFGAAVPVSLVQSPQQDSLALRGPITVHATETLSGSDVTAGGVAGRGHFRVSGALADKGRVTDFRTVKGATALLRRVAVGA